MMRITIPLFFNSFIKGTILSLDREAERKLMTIRLFSFCFQRFCSLMVIVAATMLPLLFGCILICAAAVDALAKDCPQDATIRVWPPHMPFGRPGTVYSASNLYTLYTHIGPANGKGGTGYPGGGNAWSPTPLSVFVTDSKTGAHIKGCTIRWATGIGATNGWVFPIDGNQDTDENGEARAWWVAGSAGFQEVEAYIVHPDGSRASFRVSGRAQGERVLAGAPSYGYNTPRGDVWTNWQEDVTIVKWSPPVYHTIFSGGGKFYSGINSGGPGYLFTAWWNGPNNPTKIIDPPEDGPGYKPGGKGVIFRNATHQCQQCANCPEGWHASCRLNVEWKEGSTYRAEMEFDYSSSAHTDMTIFFEDLTSKQPPRSKVGTMRFPLAFKQSGAGGFWEAPGGVKYSCLDTPLTKLIHKNIRYKTSGGEWIEIKDRTISFGNSKGCQNYWAVWRDSLNGWISSNGGHYVGYPMNYKIGASIADLTSCFDGLKNGDEYDVDCGGSCKKRCEADKETGNCNDGFMNGSEDYVDCGGKCAPCTQMGNIDTYFRIDAPKGTGFTFDEARAACLAAGSTLATIQNPYQNFAARELCSQNADRSLKQPVKYYSNGYERCWIGLKRYADCRSPACWFWADTDYNLQMTLFSPWGYGGGRGHGTNYMTGNTAMAFRVTNADKSDSINGRYGEFFASNPQERLEAALCGGTLPKLSHKSQSRKRWKVTMQVKGALTASLLPFYDNLCHTPIHLLSPIVIPALTKHRVEVLAGEWKRTKTSVCNGLVRYGIGDKWSKSVTVQGSYKCGLKSIFGPDPARGKPKHCECMELRPGGLHETFQDIQFDVAFDHPAPLGCFRVDVEGSHPFYTNAKLEFSDDGRTWTEAPFSYKGAPLSKYDIFQPFSAPLGLPKSSAATIAGASSGGFLLCVLIALYVHHKKRKRDNGNAASGARNIAYSQNGVPMGFVNPMVETVECMTSRQPGVAARPSKAANDWVKVFDESSKEFYYWNSLTDATTWDRPADMLDA